MPRFILAGEGVSLKEGLFLSARECRRSRVSPRGQMMKRTILGLAVTFIGVMAGMAQKDALIIFGQGFMFSVVEPKGWRCHTDDAFRYKMNAYFCLGSKSIKRSPAIMHIAIYDKEGDTIQQSLAFDRENYRKHSKSIEFLDFPIDELAFEFAAQTFVIDDKTIDYVCFLDPDKDSPLYVVFVLHGPKQESPKHVEAFRSLIKTFRWLGSPAKDDRLLKSGTTARHVL